RRVPLLQRGRIRCDRRVVDVALTRLDRALAVEDRLLHSVPFALLAIAQALGPLARRVGGALRRRLARLGRGGGAGRLPLRVVGERRRAARAVEGEDDRGHALE